MFVPQLYRHHQLFTGFDHVRWPAGTLRESVDWLQIHHPPRDLQVDTQDVDAEQRADGHEAENQPPLQPHGRHDESELGRQAWCALPALHAASRNIRSHRTEAAGGQRSRMLAWSGWSFLQSTRGEGGGDFKQPKTESGLQSGRLQAHLQKEKEKQDRVKMELYLSVSMETQIIPF